LCLHQQPRRIGAPFATRGQALDAPQLVQGGSSGTDSRPGLPRVRRRALSQLNAAQGLQQQGDSVRGWRGKFLHEAEKEITSDQSEQIVADRAFVASSRTSVLDEEGRRGGRVTSLIGTASAASCGFNGAISSRCVVLSAL